MHKNTSANSRDRKSADPENQFEATSFNIRNWPGDYWGENTSPKVSAFQPKVDSFNQWRQLINYLACIMMGYQKLSSNYYSAAEPC